MVIHYNVSVIIPCFNSEASLCKALDSVARQSYPVHEVICIDDGSTDQTSNLISAYKEVDIIYRKNVVNSGPSYSRNLGVSLASGDIIAFLDADDEWHPDKMRCQLALLRYYQLDFVSCSYSDAISSRVVECSGYKRVTFRKLIYRNTFCTPSVLLKKDIFDEFDTSMKYSEDYDLWLRLSRRGFAIGFINKDLVFLGKPAYGVSGLSSNLFKMEQGEIKTLLKNTSGMYQLNSVTFSIIKFIRRYLICLLRNLVVKF